MRSAAVRILRALHAALGRWLGEADQPVVKVKTNRRGSDKPRPRTRKRADPHTADPGHTIERKRTSWFDLDSGAIATPKSADEEEMEAWDRAHFRNLPGRQ
ncbi:MAG TPA: hypothetical protein VHW71_18715 [Steroidobacteraceae bacterium]|jgi:hypothetical protein|nr:hypothetical protein [Steroidobacteraceae bacterium]